MTSRRVEEMARELEALRSRRHDGSIHGLTESPSGPESAQDSPDHPSDLSGVAWLDESALGDEPFQLEDVTIEKATVVEIFKMRVLSYWC
jgi:hypothetical protein|tara:strand:- start:2950 stop:3219 length:270 start_codon:yes stop_codon:yes gene_type:complete